MKSLIRLLTSVIFIVAFSNAKSQMNYTVSFPTTVFTTLTTGTVPTLTLAYPPSLAAQDGVVVSDEGAANVVPLPFTFIYNCVAYNSCNISTNGFISLGRKIDTLNNYWTNNLMMGPIADPATFLFTRLSRPIIAPLWDDLDGIGTGTASTPANYIRYVTTGTAPNRIFTVQWLNAKWNWQGSAAAVSFQVKLYETTNVIDFIYRSQAGLATGNANASVGLSDCSTGINNFISLSKLNDSAEISSLISYDSIKIKPKTNFAIRFTPATCSQIKPKPDCKANPIILGKVFFDYNKNGILDTLENISYRTKLSVNNAYSTYTDNFGNYAIDVDTGINNQLSVVAPQNYACIPATVNFNNLPYDTFIHQNFALQAVTNFDSMQLVVTPLMWRPRLGFSYPYLIAYRNIGSTKIAPLLTFNYDSTKLRLDSFSNNNAVKGINNFTLQIDSMMPGQYGYLKVYFRVRPTVPIGDSIVTVTTLTYTDSVRLVNRVGGSYDPNDKNGTPVLTPLQVSNGKYIDYTIRFQNTGNDTAFNILVTDTLSSKLQYKTFVLEGSSHNCTATVDSNIIKFEFFNIQLPDSNVNESASHGFVKFKIKPVATLVNGDFVENKAAIYFDYNASVITNNCITQINTAGVIVPLRLISYTVNYRKQEAVQTQSVFVHQWLTNNEVNVSHFEIERSIDAVNFYNLGKVLANNKSYNQYKFNDEKPVAGILKLKAIYYRLKMVDKDGTVYYSDIKTITLNSTDNKILLYPNPASNQITIETINPSKIYIYNQLGKVVLEQSLSSAKAIINIEKFATGNYFVKVVSNDGKIYQSKFIKN